MTDDLRRQLAEALTSHRMCGGDRRGVWCACGWVGPGSEHEAHVADAVLPTVNRLVAEALMEASRAPVCPVPMKRWLTLRAQAREAS